MTLKLKNTSHSYYCSDNNYYVNGDHNFGRVEYNSWKEFQELAEPLDDDINHVFRFDITEYEEDPGHYYLELFFIKQKHGNFIPVFVHNITEDDMPEIESFLKKRWEYLKKQWIEFSRYETDEDKN